MPAPLIFSVINRYTGFIRTNISYDKNGVRKKNFNGG